MEPSFLPTTGWAIAHPTHSPVTPLKVILKLQLRLKKILDLRQFTICFQLGWKGPNLSLLKPPLNHCEKPFWTWELNVNCAFWWFVSVSHIYVLPTITQWSLAICTHAGFQILLPVCCECNFVVWYDLSFLPDILIKDSEKTRTHFSSVINVVF